MISNGEVEPGRIAKSVLVIDEAQDMDENEFALVRALMQNNDDMRVIAVGDDDQNVYEFRGSDSKHLQTLIREYGATKYEMNENYRSKANIVALANVFVRSIRNRMKVNPAQAIQENNGTVQIIHHVSDHLEEPIVNQIMQTYKGGKACVLTQTNEEALRVLGLLLKKGMRAKLIQSMDGFRLYNLAEIRFFLKQIDKQLQTPIISDEIWNKAKAQLKRTYQDSTCLEVCLNLIADFEQVNSYTKYRTDLEEFIKESNYEDFYTDDLETIYVSTIHKSKGREFENVYMLLNHFSVNSDAERRKLYVGMTRAKNSLYIHCNSNLFVPYNVPNVEKLEDTEEYPEPEEISMQLTHKDVVLDFFKDKKEIIFKLHSGAKLNLKNGFLSAEIDDRTVRVAKLSKACVEQVEYLESKGYIPFSADVRFVVAWKGEEDEQETAVLLPNIYLKK
jgi:ATP-dependent DNA helicase RecQ